MSLKTEYSRMAQKRITGVGVVPTVPATDPIDDTWLPTDLMMGEICINPDDDKMWIRTTAGIIEIATGATILGDLQDVLDNGSVATITGDVDITADNFIFNDDAVKIGDNSAAPVTTTNTAKKAVLIATQNSIIDDGVRNSSIIGGNVNNIDNNSVNSVILGGDTNDITAYSRSVILGGQNITADANDTAFADNLRLEVGGRLRMLSGTNATAGSATLVAGTVTVNTTQVQANSLIMLTHQNNSGTPGFVTVSARTAGTSFTILSSSATDTSLIGWVIIDQA